MKLGTENKFATYAAVALMVVALVMVARMFFSSSSGAEATPVTAPPATTAATPARTAKAKPGTVQVSSLDPRLHLGLLNGSENVTYAGTGRDIFSGEAEIPKPVAPGKITQKPQPQVAQGPPPPPPIPLKFYGWASRPGQPRRIFFIDNGEVVGPAGEGDVVERRYKVVRINNASVEVEDVLNNSRQTIPLAG